MLNNIYEIVFITSESCNLKCSYCHFVDKVTNAHLLETKKIEQSLYSGEYLKLYKYFVNKYNINKQKIYKVSLWGQEPTLTLKAFNTQIADILDWLPQVQRFFFSTNGASYINDIIECVNVFNNYFQLHQDRSELILSIQFSFDDAENNCLHRGIDSNIIINNIKTLINYLNITKLNKNFKVNILLHGVLTIEDVKDQLNNKNNNYWQNITNLMIELKNLSINSNVLIECYGAFFNYPYNATNEDGKILLQYAKYCYSNITEYYLDLVDYMSPFHFMRNIIKFIKDNNLLYEDMIINNFNYFPNNIIIKFNSCDPYESRINMRYDGTLLYCQNTIFDLQNIDLINRTQMDFDVAYYHLLHKNFQPNILTSSQDQISNFIQIFQNQNPYNYSFLNSNTINLMYLLLQNKQIDESYQDKEKLLRHALYLSKFGQCYYSRKTTTGSIYCNTVGNIRLYCNGLLDFLEELINKNLIEFKKGED